MSASRGSCMSIVGDGERREGHQLVSQGNDSFARVGSHVTPGAGRVLCLSHLFEVSGVYE